MAIVKNWAGRAFGTNVGNLAISLEGDDVKLVGKLRLADERYGVTVYAIKGTFDGQTLEISGEAETKREGMMYGNLTARARLNAKGELQGTWETSIGSGGTFQLFPHAYGEGSSSAPSGMTTQLYTARHDFGAISITRAEITALADEIQIQFPKQQVMVNVTVQTERIRTLEDFKKLALPEKRGRFAKLFAQEEEASGMNRTVIVELGQGGNWVSVQSADEPWALGFLEKLKQRIAPLERFYPSQYKKLGITVNQLMVFAAIAWLPSLPDFAARAGLLVGVLVVISTIDYVHKRFVPYTTIYLGDTSDGLLRRAWPTILSILITVLGGTAATLLGVVLQNWLSLVGKG
ncbi:hypothetical protein [Reyranella sp.]|uniref:hypothetical protein n=1 Tax=Reyranella sp. TaxID=1929291 RepID=UPI003C7E7D0D